MFCALLMSRYQVSVYRTNGPLVLIVILPGSVCLVSPFNFVISWHFC